MKRIILYTYILFVSFFLGGCGDFGDVNIDPNNPSTPDTRFLFTYACKRVPNFTMVGTYDPWNQLYPQYFSERQNIQYSNYALVDFSIGPYLYENIRNLEDIIRLNSDETTKNESYVIQFGSIDNQIAASRTLRAFYYMHLTDIVGMIPYSEALKGDEGNFTPIYDTQEFIYTDLDKELTEAYAQFKETETLNSSSDILYNGDISKWKKLNASLRMMMAIKLSDIKPEDGKARFLKAYTDGGMSDNVDKLSYKYLAETANQNPLYDNVVVSGRKDFAPSKTLLDQLIAYNDPRLPIYADPNQDGVYEGVPYGLTQAEIPNYKNTAVFDPQYYKQDFEMIVISPSHILLIAAEAAVRKWIPDDAETLYKAGIEASFNQYGLSGEIETYFNQDAIKLAGTDEQKIQKIGMQRWLANYMQDGVEAWSDWRRLNVPVLKPGPNATVTHIPYRRQYYPDDYLTNKANYDAAIAAQGPDNFDTRVWWDVADNN